ncbi:MAG: sulfate reduction electron transfer complex DsrMKJOP subunit DsrJ [Desulfosarcinaceae bacterium]
MNDRNKIIAGLIVFLAVFTFPVWYNLGKAAPAPELKLTDKAKEAKTCVMPTEYMRSHHMQVLDLWRQSVVRDAKRVFVNAEGKAYTISLSNTCLDCHSNKADFCDKCHNYASVSPYCWDCHLDNPKGE